MTTGVRRFEGSAMSRVTLDAELRKKLGDLSQVIELCDESGRVVGQIVPTANDFFEPPFDKAELDRIANETTQWYTSDEVSAMLRKLEAEHP